jgi:hypothetical protein
VKGFRRCASPIAGLVLCVGVALQAHAAGPHVALVDGVPARLQNLFPIGVWVEPYYLYATWQSRGVNTLVGIDFDIETSITQANSLGMYMIREPQANPADDANQPLLLAWAQPDEPDGIDSQVPYSSIQAQYNTWKGIDANIPVFINFVGDLNQYDLVTHESGDAWYEKYVLGADWICADKYPVNEGDAGDLGVMGRTMDHLQILAGDKPIFAFIESSDIDTTDGNPGPSPGQLRAEMWEVIIHGARGIWFFPEQISPTFLSDTTPANVVTEMTLQNANITALAAVLQGAVNPAEVSATIAAPLDIGWRDTTGAAYFIAVNLSANTLDGQSIAVSGSDLSETVSVFGESRSVPVSAGTLTDDFAPYAVHIYIDVHDEIFRDGFE